MSMPTSIAELPSDRAAAQVDALAIGPWHQLEFAEATASIAEWESWAHLESFEEALESLSQVDVAPELIFLAQPLPGIVRQASVDRLQLAAPLARIVVVAGTWCEGELRTGQPPGGVLRLYWCELASWWRAASKRLTEGRFPSWSLPLDHPQAGRFCAVSNRESLPEVVAIDAEDYAVFETLAEAVQNDGSQPVWANRLTNHRATAGIWDGGQLAERELVRLRRFCKSVAGPVAVLLDFPRVEHQAQARETGAAAVFAKPYIVDEVLASLALSES